MPGPNLNRSVVQSVARHYTDLATPAPVGYISGGKQMILRKTCHSATLSTTNPTSTALVVNPDLRGEKPVANRLCYGMAHKWLLRSQQ
jgi:hypothetical protein